MAVLLCAFAQVATAAAQAAPFDWKARGVLFRVEALAPADAGGVAATPTRPSRPWSYLFATIHYGDAAELALDLARLRERVSETRVLVNEVSGAEQWRPEYERYRTLPTGTSLRGLIGDPAFALLQSRLPQYPVATLDGLKPWVAMSMLELPDSDQDSIDIQLEDWARASGMRLVHLENLPEQLAALDCVPSQDYAVVLVQRLRGGWSFEQEARRTAGYYRHRDLPAWLGEIERMPGLDGEAIAIERSARGCLIEARNQRWLPVLEELLRADRCFVAVGAIHLTGEHGLLAQLSQRGFTVTVEPW